MNKHAIYTDGYYIYQLIQNDQYFIVRHCDGCGMSFRGEFFPLRIQGEFYDQVLYCTTCMSKLLPMNFSNNS